MKILNLQHRSTKTVIKFLNLQHTNSSQMVRSDLAVSHSKQFPPQMHPLEPFPIFHMNPQVRARAMTVQPLLMIAISQCEVTHPILPCYSLETDQLLVQFPSLVQHRSSRTNRKQRKLMHNFLFHMFYGSLPFASSGCFGC